MSIQGAYRRHDEDFRTGRRRKAAEWFERRERQAGNEPVPVEIGVFFSRSLPPPSFVTRGSLETPF